MESSGMHPGHGWPECYLCQAMSRVMYPVFVEGELKYICKGCLKEEMNE